MKDLMRLDNENARVAEARQIDINDRDIKERLDRICRIAQRMFSVPMVDFSLILDDTQEVFSSCGSEETSIPRDISFAQYALGKSDVFVVLDTMEDDRFSGNPQVVSHPRIRFVATAPVRTKAGHKVGALTISDKHTRTFKAYDQSALRDLAEMIGNELSYAKLSTIDSATKLLTPLGFYHLAEQGLKLCEREKNSAVAVVFTMKMSGSGSPDMLHRLKEKSILAFSEQLKYFFRKSDVVGRFGPNEFTALLLNAKREHVDEIVRKLQASIDIYNTESQEHTRLSFVHALAEFDPRHPTPPDVLVAEASSTLNRSAA